MYRTFTDIIEDIAKHNDYHDERGRFARKDTGKASACARADPSSKEYKKKQLDIILQNNPAEDDYHTWIRSTDDIMTFSEAFDSDMGDITDYRESEKLAPDYTVSMVKDAMTSGKITVYSSYDIDQGTFVTPSKIEAESYGGGKCNKREVNIEDVAWIDPLQGQYAKVS